MQWHVKLNLRLNDHYYRLCDQRILHLQGCFGELATLEKCCNVVVHMIHTAVAILRPFGSGSKAEVSLSEQRHRIKKSHIWKCDTCSELK